MSTSPQHNTTNTEHNNAPAQISNSKFEVAPLSATHQFQLTALQNTVAPEIDKQLITAILTQPKIYNLPQATSHNRIVEIIGKAIVDRGWAPKQFANDGEKQSWQNEQQLMIRNIIADINLDFKHLTMLEIE